VSLTLPVTKTDLHEYASHDVVVTVESSVKENYTPLLAATALNKEKAVVALLEAGADPNQIASKGPARGPSPLHLLPSERIAQILIDKGANVNLKTNHSNVENATPLMVAALAGRKDMIRFLLARGADIKARDAEGNTALRFVHPVRADVRQLLLEHGADPKKAGLPPAQLSALRKRREQEEKRREREEERRDKIRLQREDQDPNSIYWGNGRGQ
jgi:hypothetical protein